MTETADIRKIHIVFDGQETPPLKSINYLIHKNTIS